VYFDMIYPSTVTRFFTIALGSFVDPVFEPPTTEYFTSFRHPWVPPTSGAVQVHDPLGADAEQAWRETDNGRRAGDIQMGESTNGERMRDAAACGRAGDLRRADVPRTRA
jgi:hypothetical protein